VLVREAISDLGLDCEVLTTDPHHLSDVLEDVDRLGAAIGRETEARRLRADLESRVKAVRERVADAERPRTLVLDWPDPPMVAGHWIPGMVETAGGEFGLAEPGGHSGPVEWDAIREHDPEVLVLAPCGYGLDRTFEHLDSLTDREGWAELSAVRAGRAYAMDGHHYVNRPGPRLVDTLEHLAALLHPDRFETPPSEVVRPLARTPV
jgi:iron complex transport system substrate-binding protein